MANRAYLYSSDRPDGWEVPEQDYYDSRHSIPLAWFFFYQPNDIRMVDVHYQNSKWQEVKLSAEMPSALNLFAMRKSLLMSMVQDRLGLDTIDEFIAKVQNRSGKYLLMNPEEILSDEATEDAARFAKFLIVLGDGNVPNDVARRATRPYVPTFDRDPDRCLCQIIGYTYS